MLPLSESQRVQLEEVTRLYPMSLTPYYASLIDPDNAHCPILRQVVPSPEELDDADGLADPLCEASQSPVENIIRIYPDRVAFTVFNQCPVRCRFCFRKRLFAPAHGRSDVSAVEEGLRYIAAEPEIRDVLLTGGDPLMASDQWLESLLARVRSIPHVEIIRIGTRTPVVLPQRITPRLCRILARFHPIWVNTHFNHPRELTPEAAEACDRLTRVGIPVGNQSVLLKGVNDDASTMERLVRGLVHMRVRPYYLFQCHLVSGTRHFRTSVETGLEITKALRGHVSGIANPLFVVDTPRGKVPLLPRTGWAGRDGDDVVLETFRGAMWRERNPVDGNTHTEEES
jgi:lysine 2,3-aminomutase